MIDRDSIAAAVRRREGEAAGEPPWRRCLVWAMLGSPRAVKIEMSNHPRKRPPVRSSRSRAK